jgi:hypothetical protein
MSAGDLRLPAEQPERRPPRPHTRRFPAREENGQGDGNEDSLGPVEDEDDQDAAAEGDPRSKRGRVGVHDRIK